MWCKEKKYKEKLLWIVGNFKICTTFATANEKNGSLDEWLSQRSAKPCTAVRIRQEPLEVYCIFYNNKYTKRSYGALDEWLSQWSAKPCTAVRICQAPL